jgi:hypothetical protein
VGAGQVYLAGLPARSAHTTKRKQANINVSAIQELLDEVDRDGSGECEYPEFVEIMTISLNKIREEQEKSGDKQGPDISFDLMATAYRRKRLMEGLMSGDRLRSVHIPC